MVINIDKAKLYKAIRVNIEYIARGSDYERISIIDEDAELLDRFYQSSVDTISNTLNRFVEKCNITSSGICFDINAPAFDGAKIKQLTSAFFNTIEQDVCFKWLSKIAPDLSNLYNETAKQALSELTALIYKRIL